MWFSACWYATNSSSSALKLIYDSVSDIINWSKDEFWVFTQDPAITSFHMDYLKQAHERTDEEIAREYEEAP